jgi:L-rhamnose-proton symport protein (RhaT)
MSTFLGILVVTLAGLLIGSALWPMKVMRRFQFEHWWFWGMSVGLVVIPWLVTLIFCPHALAAYRTVDVVVLAKGNLFSLAWGIANVLCGLCFERIGFALTGGILAGLGVSVGVTLPMIFKGSGLFSAAPDLGSPAGRTVLVGVGVMLVGVIFVSLVGFGRERALSHGEKRSGGFRSGLIMAAISGVLSAGLSLSFVYSQGPVVAAMKAKGSGDIAANFAVWAAGLVGGAFVNLSYPVYLMFRNKSWKALLGSWREAGLAALIGVNFCGAVALMGKGMLLLGVLGASVGFGIQQGMQMLGNQGVGFVSGEWRGVYGTPRKQMYLAIVILLLAAMIMAYGNGLATG